MRSRVSPSASSAALLVRYVRQAPPQERFVAEQNQPPPRIPAEQPDRLRIQIPARQHRENGWIPQCPNRRLAGAPRPFFDDPVVFGPRCF